MVVFIDQPFQIGEYVIIDGSIEGVIEEVGFRSTRIRTLDKTLISVPNAKIAHSTVNNFAKIPERRFKCTLGLRYDTTTAQMESFIEALRTYLTVFFKYEQFLIGCFGHGIYQQQPMDRFGQV